MINDQITLEQAKRSLIVALDFDNVEQANNLVLKVKSQVSFYKIGYQLMLGGGFRLARELIDQGHRVFLDLKLHDIGATVEKATKQVVGLGVNFLTVHAYPQTLMAAHRGREGSELKILGVTVMTSYADQDLIQAGYKNGVEQTVAMRIKQVASCGCDGVICSGFEAGMTRRVLGDDALVVTPGIRLETDSSDDQKRVMTPQKAIAGGASHIVVGRSITAAKDPAKAAEMVINNILGA